MLLILYQTVASETMRHLNPTNPTRLNPGNVPDDQPASGVSTRSPAGAMSSVLFHVLGEAVTDRAGQPLGTIDDLLFDQASGAIVYAVMVGADERQLVLPWCALRFDAGQRQVMLDVEARRLAKAPCIDRTHWPTPCSTAWHLAVHRHYGVTPYWRR